LNDRETEKAKSYVETLLDAMAPLVSGKNIYCDNYAVNAVAAHYLGIAESDSIATDVRLNVPEDTGKVPAMDLCVIMGNFLENALEACRRMKHGDKVNLGAAEREDRLGGKFIRVRSLVESGTLSLVVENSFDGLWSEEGGVYLSRKTQARAGVGLASVRTVCGNHGGLVQFEISENVWTSSAIVEL
jgi:sensor histidine kinase regulating citrate/malate metabolism